MITATKVNAFPGRISRGRIPRLLPGLRVGPNSGYRYCAYGIGDTEEEMLADCLEMMAQQRVRFGRSDGEANPAKPTAPRTIRKLRTNWGCRKRKREEFEESGERPYFHVGIKWNESN